jgi:hypothetical protein
MARGNHNQPLLSSAAAYWLTVSCALTVNAVSYPAREPPYGKLPPQAVTWRDVSCVTVQYRVFKLAACAIFLLRCSSGLPSSAVDTPRAAVLPVLLKRGACGTAPGASVGGGAGAVGSGAVSVPLGDSSDS